MFSCNKCQTFKVLSEALEFERQRNKELQDRLVALADAKAYHSITYMNNQGYSSDDDEYIDYDDFGQEILVKKEASN